MEFYSSLVTSLLLGSMSEESDFAQKYGPVKIRWISEPYNNGIFVKPYALNYFYKGELYRTPGERTSGKFELFFDLLYVGIVARLAKAATESANGIGLLRYVLLFMPAWQIWADMKDFMNYYYNNDITQKLYVLWQMTLLIFYSNNANNVGESRTETAYVVVPYIISRMSAIVITLIYTVYIKEHRRQMRSLAVATTCTCAIWISVIFVSNRAKVAVAFVCIALDIFFYSIAFHPWFKKLVGAEYSTAANIEHEVDRIGAFYIIAIGEFLYTIVTNSPSGGFSHNFARAIMILIISYCYIWFYFNGDGSSAACHAIRRSVGTAFAWIYIHIPITASLILAADAAGELVASNVETTKKHVHGIDEADLEGASEQAVEAVRKLLQMVRREAEEEAETHYSLQFFVTGGLCVALLCIFIHGLLDKSRDPPGSKKLSPGIWRILPRVPIAIIILCLVFAEMKTTLLLGIIALLTTLLLAFETWAMSPASCDAERKAHMQRMEMYSEMQKEIDENNKIQDSTTNIEHPTRSATGGGQIDEECDAGFTEAAI